MAQPPDFSANSPSSSPANSSANPFARALSGHDPNALRVAFASCNSDRETAYNRTTLTRWLDRSVPRDGEFVQCLANRLEDPALFEAWQKARQSSDRGGGVDVAIERFRALTQDERVNASPEIRRLFLEQYPSVRSRLTFRVDLHDGVDSADEVFDIRLVIRWTGRLPENANVAFVRDQSHLGDAFADEACIFREALTMNQDDLDRLLEDAEQILSYKPLNEDNPNITTLLGWRGETGPTFTFDKDRVKNADIRLDLRYPYPKSERNFAIRFGKYQVAGMSEIVFAPHTDEVTDPQCRMPYLPSGEQRAWASSKLPRGELVVYLGSDGTLLSEGDGVVLSWS